MNIDPAQPLAFPWEEGCGDHIRCQYVVPDVPLASLIVFGAKNHENPTAQVLLQRRHVNYIVMGAAVVLAGFLIYRTLSQYSWEELVTAVRAVSKRRLLLAAGFTAASYLTLTGFDWLALRYAGRPLPWRRAALASFTSLSLGHNIGFAALSSGAIRYRYYSRWGLAAEDVARVILFCAVTVGIGLSVLGGIGLMASPHLAHEVVGLPPTTIYVIGLIALGLPAVYILSCALLGGYALRVRALRLEIPPLKLAVAQLIIGPLNFAFVAAALHQAVRSVADVNYLEVAAVYVSANVASLITHAPGGLGVIESVVLFLLPQADLIGAVLVFRFVYFLLPLLFGSILLVTSEVLIPWVRSPRAP